MECADFWLHEKALVHKLFKVLVPRFAEYTKAFTSLYLLAPKYEAARSEKVHWKDRLEARSGAYPLEPGRLVFTERAVLELKGASPSPSLAPSDCKAGVCMCFVCEEESLMSHTE